MSRSHPQTNVQFMVELMEFSAHGALVQVFVLQALTYYAQRVAAADPEVLDTRWVNGNAWHGCAIEVQQELKRHLEE